MKRMIIGFILLLVACLGLLAQGKVTTRKYRLADFPDRVTKVVLSGSEMLQGTLRQEVVDKWTASPFEFCSPEEFQAQMSDERYYFLVVTENRFKDEEGPGLLFLSLLKGGKAAEEEGIGGLFEVIGLPVQAAEGGTGRELVFLGALVKAVQDFTLAAMKSEKVAYQGADWFNARYHRSGKGMPLCIAREDLSEEAEGQDFQRYLNEDNRLLPADEADMEYLTGGANTLVSYTVVPVAPSGGSFCYVMLFEGGSENLVYIDRHKAGKGAGILPGELKKFFRRK